MAELKLWDKSTKTVYNESCMFVFKRSSNLLFPAREIIKVSNPTLGVDYEAGRDYLHTPGTREITIPEDSRIPFCDESVMYPVGDDVKVYPDPEAIAVTGDDKKYRFHAGNWFACNQVEITYIAEVIDWEVDPEFKALDKLPNFRKKLKSGEPVVISLIGDSISEGYNATAFVKSPPFQPQYAELLRAELEKRYRHPVIMHNRAINGTGCRSAEKIKADYEGDAPDLLIIAYGMNDFFSLTAENFIEVLDGIIASCRKTNPHTEYLLISSMNGNPEWKYTHPGKDRLFSDAMQKYAASQDCSVAIANNFIFWQQLQQYKSYFDITGNGVNHPNDYGHRFQASAILNTLDLDGEYF